MSSRLDANPPYVPRGESRPGPDPRQAIPHPAEQRPRVDLRASGNTYQAHPSASSSQRLPLLDRTNSQRFPSDRLPPLDRAASLRPSMGRLPLLDRTGNLPPVTPLRSYANGQANQGSDSANDSQMATRQIQYQQLPVQEQQEQEQWAQNRLSQIWETCHQGYQWMRVDGGYRCSGMAHFVTDELVAEGKGYYFNILHASPLHGAGGPSRWIGPFHSSSHYTVLNGSRYQLPPAGSADLANFPRNMYLPWIPSRRLGGPPSLRPPMGAQPVPYRYSGFGGRPSLRPPMGRY